MIPKLFLGAVFKAEGIGFGCTVGAEEEVFYVSFSLRVCLPYVSEHSLGTATVGADLYAKLRTACLLAAKPPVSPPPAEELELSDGGSEQRSGTVAGSV